MSPRLDLVTQDVLVADPGFNLDIFNAPVLTPDLSESSESSGLSDLSDSDESSGLSDSDEEDDDYRLDDNAQEILLYIERILAQRQLTQQDIYRSLRAFAFILYAVSLTTLLITLLPPAVPEISLFGNQNSACLFSQNITDQVMSCVCFCITPS